MLADFYFGKEAQLLPLWLDIVAAALNTNPDWLFILTPPLNTIIPVFTSLQIYLMISFFSLHNSPELIWWCVSVSRIELLWFCGVFAVPCGREFLPLWSLTDWLELLIGLCGVLHLVFLTLIRTRLKAETVNSVNIDPRSSVWSSGCCGNRQLLPYQ